MTGGTFILDYSLYNVNMKIEIYLIERRKKMITEKIETLCKERNIKISRLEKECGIGNGTIARWDKSYPRTDNLKKVSDYFGVPIGTLLDDETGPEQEKEVG